MCTLSYYPTVNGFILTSNRDELESRMTIAPQIYPSGAAHVIMPIDEREGGTWIGTSTHLTVCLLNGGCIAHNKSDYPNALSRGHLVRTAFMVDDLWSFLDSIPHDSYEPFTLVVVVHKEKLEIHELVWDGRKVHHQLLNTTHSFLWSSSTLYDENIKQQRKMLFHDAVRSGSLKSPSHFIAFHSSQPLGEEQGFRIKRANGISTVSISQVVLADKKVTYRYLDLKENTPIQQWEMNP